MFVVYSIRMLFRNDGVATEAKKALTEHVKKEASQQICQFTNFLKRLLQTVTSSVLCYFINIAVGLFRKTVTSEVLRRRSVKQTMKHRLVATFSRHSSTW